MSARGALNVTKSATMQENVPAIAHGTSGFLKQQIVSLTCPVCGGGYSRFSQSGRIVQSKVSPRVVYPLSVSVQANGKKRLILDLS